MKTIREVIEALEAREKERDEVERERVKAVILNKPRSGWQPEHLITMLYPPPPEPETLSAGWYGIRTKSGLKYPYVIQQDFVPQADLEYRPIANPFDPPPEVTGKAEPIGQFTCCACEKTFPMMSRSAHVATICTGCYVSDKHPPTFEEWCAANVCEWEMHSPNWYYTPTDKIRHLPIEVFKELSGYDYGTSSKRSYKSSEQANAALKAALLKLGRIRP